MDADSTEHSESLHQGRRPLLANLRIVSLGTLLSRVLGLGRDIGMASLFGAGTTLDAFIVAFRLPNLTRQLFGEGALTTAFLPVFIKDREESGPEAARATLSAVAVALTSVLTLFVLISEAIGWTVMSVVSLSEANQLLLTLLLIMLPYLVFICLAALCCAALHALRIFLWPALVPVVLNVFWLIGIGVAWNSEAVETAQIKWIAGTIVFAGLLQLLLPVWALIRCHHGFDRRWPTAWPRVMLVMRTMLPVIGGLAILQVNTVIDSILAWLLARTESGEPAWIESLGLPALLEPGTASALYIGQRMYQFPLGVFGVALGTVLYPVLTQHAQRGQMELLREDLLRGLRIVVAIGVPASAGLVCLARPVTTALFLRGQFTAEDARLTSTMIAVYGMGVWAFIALSILNRAFYATGDRLTPMRLGSIALGTNVAANLLLVGFIGGAGLALGSVLASLIQFVLTAQCLHRSIGPFEWKSLVTTLWRTGLATTCMAVGCLVAIDMLPETTRTLTEKVVLLVVPMGVGVALYLMSARIIGLREPFELLKRESGLSLEN